MLDQPKMITVPGIPDQLREQTLAEYVQAIPDKNHLVHRELRELQRAYLELPKLQAQIVDLKSQVGSLIAEQVAVPAVPIPEIAPETQATAAKLPCPFCGKLVTTLAGPWASHMKTKHGESDVPVPVV